MKGNKKYPKNITKTFLIQQQQSLKIQKCQAATNQKQISDRDDYQNSSEANWQIKKWGCPNYDKYRDGKSNYSVFQSRKAVLANLCKVVGILRNKMPDRSLEQIIIRVYQAIQLKREHSQRGSAQEYSACNDFAENEENNQQLHVKKEADLQSNVGNQRFMPIRNSYQINRQLNQGEDTQVEPQQHHFQIKQKKRNEQLFQNNLNQHEANYIYKPKGQEVVIQYLQKDTLKTKFVNIQEQTRYNDQRFVAQSFINRGYGVCECRKQMQLQNRHAFMHRDTYKALSTSMMIFAFRKLESFISIECGKKIKFIDRHQMQSIYITLLNCRINMQPEYVITLMKYIKACYGIGDVVIGEIESVKLYLNCQKYLYGKNVTMQFLQKIGEIKHKKEIQQTLVYINNRSKRYQQRLVTLRRTRKQKKMRLISSNKSLSICGQANVQPQSTQVKTEGGQSHNSAKEELKVQDIQFNEEQDIQIEFAKQYINNNQISSCASKLKMKFSELQTWKQQHFQELFTQVMSKALKKVQMEAEINKDLRVKWLSILQVQLLDKFVWLHVAEPLRIQFLSYFLLTEPHLGKLKQVLAKTKSFVTQFQSYTHLQNQNQEQSLNSLTNSVLSEQINYQGSLNISLGYDSLYTSQDQDYKKHIIEESIFDSQLQNLSAELFNEVEYRTNNQTSNTDQSYLLNLQNHQPARYFNTNIQ